MRKELLKGLTDEQIKKIEACKDSEEILALAKEEGVELNDEQLEAVSGGCGKEIKCPKCGSKDIKVTYESENNVDRRGGRSDWEAYRCRDCGHKWDNL